MKLEIRKCKLEPQGNSFTCSTHWQKILSLTIPCVVMKEKQLNPPYVVCGIHIT